MTDLITALESAKEGSTALDFEIQQFIEGWRNIGGGYREWPDGRRERYDYIRPAPAFTTSLDAALTLVDGDRWTVYSGPARAVVGFRDGANGATPALALCIACLRARSQSPVSKPEGENV